MSTLDAEWKPLDTLPDTGKFLILDALTGGRWVSSRAGKPWKHNGTHWCEMPEVDAAVAEFHAAYIREWGQNAYRELLAEREITSIPQAIVPLSPSKG